MAQLSYGRRERQFIGQPVEDLAHVNATLIDRYHGNRQHIDELRIMEKNIDLIDNPNDKAILSSQIDNTDKILKSVHESGAYEHAFDAVRQAGTEFATNKGLQIARTARMQQQEAFEKIDNMEGLSTRYKGIAKQISMDDYQGTRQDENGEWIGGFNAYVPPEVVDGTKMADELLKGINSNRYSENGWDLVSAEVNAHAQVYMQNHGISIEEIDEERVADIVKTYLMNDPKALAWSQAKAEMDTYAEFGRDGIPNVENVTSRLYSRMEFRQRVNRSTKREGETDNEFVDRIDAEYKDEIEEYVNNEITNVQQKYEDDGVEYDMSDIMRGVYQNALVTENIQASMDILAGKYGFQKRDVSHDIKLNAFNQRMYERQEKLQASIFKGNSLPLEPNRIFESLNDISNQLTSRRRAIQNLEDQLDNAKTPEQARIIESQLEDERIAFNNLKAQENDYNRSLSSLKLQVPREIIISNDIKSAINHLPESITRQDGTVINKQEISDILEQSIYDGLTYEEVENKLGKEITNKIYSSHPIPGGMGVSTRSLELLYNLSKQSYQDEITKVSKENPQYINTITILTQGSDFHDYINEEIPYLIANNFANFTDLIKGVNLNDKDFQEILTNNEGIEVAFGGIARDGTSEPVFNLTVKDADGEPHYYTVAVTDFGDSLLDSMIDELHKFEQAESVPMPIRRTLNDYRRTIQGSNMRVSSGGYGTIGNAVKAMGINNTWNVGDSNEDNPLNTELGNLVISKVGETRYKFEFYGDDQSTLPWTLKDERTGSIYFNTPESAYKHIEEALGILYEKESLR